MQMIWLTDIKKYHKSNFAGDFIDIQGATHDYLIPNCMAMLSQKVSRADSPCNAILGDHRRIQLHTYTASAT